MDVDAAIQQFIDAMAAAGLSLTNPIQPDGELHRCSANEKKADTAGWYILHVDGVAAGAFGSWRGGWTKRWRADIGRALSPEEKDAYRARVEDMRKAHEAEDARLKAEARTEAAATWQAAQPAPDNHPYLVKKGVKPHGLRMHKGDLVVPMREGEVLHSLQYIKPDGTKLYLFGGRKRGCYCIIGELLTPLCIAEGFATAASIHEVTGHAVAVAFDAGNLLPVAQSFRERFPDLHLIICADDDVNTLGNPGMAKAEEAAQAEGASLAVPDFGPDRPEDTSDFNDLHTHLGAEAVQACIDGARGENTRSSNGAAPGATIDWPLPRPIAAELATVPQFDPTALLPAPLLGWIMDEAERMPCPPDFIAAAALVALGSIIGARCAIKPKSFDQWLVVPNLWGGVVGDPSAKKSPAWNAAMKPLDRLIAKAVETHASVLADFETEKVVFDAKRDAIKDRIKGAAKGKVKRDPASIAKELRAHDEQAPQTPVLRRYKTNDTTVEKLGELLRENPAGLLVVRDELVGLIATWDREGREGDRAFFLEAWNGDQSFDTDRIGRGHIRIPNVCASIFGGIQPDKLVVYLEEASHALANDGMLQRFQMLVYPDARPWEWRNRAPDKAARDAAFAVFEALAVFDPVDRGAAPADDFAKFPYYCFDNEAQAVFIEWSEDLHRTRMPKEEEPIVQQHLAKFDKLFPALALIFHLVDCAAGDIRGPVSKEAALRAAAWCEYLEAHARRCYGLLKDDGLRAAKTLSAKLERGALEDGFTVRDVRRNRWRNLTNDGAIQAALDWLEDESWLRGETAGGTGPGSGRRTRRYRINPAIRAKCKGSGS